jgi:hypothetical protein
VFCLKKLYIKCILIYFKEITTPEKGIADGDSERKDEKSSEIKARNDDKSDSEESMEDDDLDLTGYAKQLIPTLLSNLSEIQARNDDKSDSEESMEDDDLDLTGYAKQLIPALLSNVCLHYGVRPWGLSKLPNQMGLLSYQLDSAFSGSIS